MGQCSIYEIDGRLLVRTDDRCEGMGIERQGLEALDGFPNLDPAVVGALVAEAMARTQEIPRPATWMKLREHAQPLLAASPVRYASFRSWQRAARHVSASNHDDTISVYRWHPDLSRGSWEPAHDVHRPVGDWPQKIVLPSSAPVGELGAAVIATLSQPSLRDG